MNEVERRRNPRVETDVPLSLTFREATVETRIRNLSTSGIQFKAPASLPLLSRVQIALELPERGGGATVPLAITGVVVRCDEAGQDAYDTAIYFDDLSKQARARLTQFVTGALP